MDPRARGRSACALAAPEVPNAQRAVTTPRQRAPVGRHCAPRTQRTWPVRTCARLARPQGPRRAACRHRSTTARARRRQLRAGPRAL